MALLDTLTTEQQLQALYIGYFDRAADPAGADFWRDVIANTSLDLIDVASDFATQDETLETYPFLDDPTIEEANAFVTEVFLNLFNRPPEGPDDVAEGELDGLTFWSEALIASINGDEGALSVGQIIASIIDGAQGVDAVTVVNKIEVGIEWTAAAEVVGGEFTDELRESASTIIGPVTDAQATVDAAKAEIAEFFAPGPVEGNTLFLTSSTDVTGFNGLDSTDDDDTFLGFIAQNGFTGGVSNSLSSADRLDGQGGTDTLYAELTSEFVGATSGGATIDVQPKLNNIEIVEIEARDTGNGGTTTGSTSVDLDVDLSESFPALDFFLGDLIDDITDAVSLTLNEETEGVAPVAVFDGKDSFGIDVIGSVNSDGDLVIENLNTLANEDDAVGRRTGEITITMDHTDNFNSDGDAADLTVYFDENFLLANDPVQSGALLTIELMDLDAQTLGQDPLLDNPFGAITFTFGDELKELNFGTASNTYAELLADVQAAIDLAAQTDPDFSQLSASFGPIFTVRDTDEDPNPARPPLDGTTIVITNSGPEILEAVNMIATGTQPAGKDFHTGFDNEAPEEQNFKIEVDIDLHKVGRGGEGGNLIVGGKDQGPEGEGIHIFNVDVLGAGESDDSSVAPKPSNLGTLTSTNGALGTVNIATAAEFVDGDTWASLTIRDGFNHVGADGETGDLQLVNANDFLGDLTLGTGEAIINLDTLTALGGGDVTFVGVLDGEETNQNYVYLTGSGSDTVSVTIEGDALDYANSGLEIKTGGGADTINVDLAIVNGGANDVTNEQLNQAILDNVDIDGEGGDDIINVDGIGNANIDGSDGDDIIYTDGDSANGSNTVWAFNFDDERADFNGLIGVDPDDLPGVETSLAYLDGATVTVTLSGAGVLFPPAGGGVMALPGGGAIDGEDGYEASFTITDLINGNEFYGDQRDVNAAIIAAIEGDEVLDALLSVSIAANNTLVIASKTSGDFASTDLRIDIEHGEATDSAYATAVLNEARELFNDSSLTLTDLWGGTTFTDARDYETDGSAPGAVFADSTTANAWYDGLSVDGDFNSAADNLHTFGAASIDETDNVINGGDGDDIIVLSTDAVGNFVPPFLDGGNNAMINGASNETIVLEGDDFGDDTVMNFTTAVTTVSDQAIDQQVAFVDSAVDGTDEVVDPGTPESFILDVTQVPPTLNPYEVTFDTVSTPVPGNTGPLALAGLIAAEYAAASPSGWTAVDNGDGTVTFTQATVGDLSPNVSVAGDWDSSTPLFEDTATLTVTDGTPGGTTPPTAAEVVLSFVDEALPTLTDGTITILGTSYLVADGDLATDIAATVAATPPADYTAVDNLDGTVTLTSTIPGPVLPTIIITDAVIDGTTPIDTIAQGLDFLDFTSYLTSLEDNSVNSTAAPDSNVSHTPIPVTLDFDLVDVIANEVSVIQFNNTDDANETFGNLSESVVEQLFNNGSSFTGFGDDQNYGNLSASGANADDEYAEPTNGTDPLVAGAAKSIVLIENADNLGHYKVFELSWNGDASTDADSTLDGVVDANLIGSLDFGTSLLGLDDVNLVGSEDYDFLNDVGILNFV